MKNFFYISLLFLAVNANAQTSVYHPFPDSNASWNYHYMAYCFANGTGDDYYSIQVSGDTIINSLTYHKLNTPYVQSFSTGTCGGAGVGYKGAIRQDTSIKRVYFIPPADTVEYLLYDFSMEVGDTVRGYTETIAIPSSDVVQSIDSVLVGTTYRKRWLINNCYDIYFIEGIGSTYGLFGLSPGCITDQPVYTLTCFQQNGFTIYPDTTINCELITGIEGVDNFFSELNIFPNPSNGSFTIENGINTIKEIIITGLPGNIVILRKPNNDSKIYIDNLPSGTYILTIIDTGNFVSNRKIFICP